MLHPLFLGKKPIEPVSDPSILFEPLRRVLTGGAY